MGGRVGGWIRSEVGGVGVLQYNISGMVVRCQWRSSATLLASGLFEKVWVRCNVVARDLFGSENGHARSHGRASIKLFGGDVAARFSEALDPLLDVSERLQAHFNCPGRDILQHIHTNDVART